MQASVPDVVHLQGSGGRVHVRRLALSPDAEADRRVENRILAHLLACIA